MSVALDQKLNLRQSQ